MISFCNTYKIKLIQRTGIKFLFKLKQDSSLKKHSKKLYDLRSKNIKLGQQANRPSQYTSKDASVIKKNLYFYFITIICLCLHARLIYVTFPMST